MTDRVITEIMTQSGTYRIRQKTTRNGPMLRPSTGQKTVYLAEMLVGSIWVCQPQDDESLEGAIMAIGDLSEVL